MAAFIACNAHHMMLPCSECQATHIAHLETKLAHALRVLAVAQERIKALEEMATCYRLSRRPSETELTRWDRARDHWTQVTQEGTDAAN